MQQAVGSRQQATSNQPSAKDSIRWLLVAGCWLLIAGCWLPSAPALAADDRYGVLILAHGGQPAWNAAVQAVVEQAQVPYPTEVVFGMGMMAEEISALQAAVHRLEQRGITRLLVVPLLVSSYSEVYRQYEFLLGLRTDSPWPDHTPSAVQLRVPVRLGSPLDSHPYMAEILLDRAQSLSQDPAGEAVVFVAHGPNADADNAEWLAHMGQVAALVQRRGRFAAVVTCTLRDDAEPAVREEATRLLRATVETHGRRRRVLVVPLLIARGGIEQKITERLQGLTYIFSGETLLPHPRIATWIHDSVVQLALTVAWQQKNERWRVFWYN